MSQLCEKGAGWLFDNYPIAHHATDVVFVHGLKPALSYDESLDWFSMKHKLYGQKVKASVIARGLASNWMHEFPAGEHNKNIAEANIKYHLKSAKKRGAELTEQDFGEGYRLHPDKYAVLMDKAYIGIEDQIRAIIPERNPPRGHLPQASKERNRLISHDRVLPENYFGHNAKINGLFAKQYTLSRDRLDVLVDFCFSLTNFHISLHPLREADREYYHQLLADLKRRAEDAKKAMPQATNLLAVVPSATATSSTSANLKAAQPAAAVATVASLVQLANS